MLDVPSDGEDMVLSLCLWVPAGERTIVSLCSKVVRHDPTLEQLSKC